MATYTLTLGLLGVHTDDSELIGDIVNSHGLDTDSSSTIFLFKGFCESISKTLRKLREPAGVFQELPPKLEFAPAYFKVTSLEDMVFGDFPLETCKESFKDCVETSCEKSYTLSKGILLDHCHDCEFDDAFRVALRRFCCDSFSNVRLKDSNVVVQACLKLDFEGTLTATFTHIPLK